MAFHGRSADHKTLFVNVSRATRAKQSAITKYSHGTIYLLTCHQLCSHQPRPPNQPALAMILVQKPPTLTPSQFPLHSHRRHPSAPSTVVVVPTRTPGILTLSKPPRLPPQRQNQRQIPKPLPKSKSTQVVRASPLNSPAEITDNTKSAGIALPATPSPQPRGRGQIKHTKDGVQNHR
jgi:hypothetical protein